MKRNILTERKRSARHGSVAVRSDRRTDCLAAARPEGRRLREKSKSSNGGSHSAIRTIVVPVDFTESSCKALDYAVLLAKRLDASIALLHVVERCYAEGFVDGARFAIRIEAREHAMRRLNMLAKSKLNEGAAIRCIARHGVPEYEIIRFAESTSADLIVIGRKLRNSLSRFVFGSVTRDVIDAAHCPVLVI